MTHDDCYYDEYDSDRQDFCAHDEYDADWEGRATCLYCGAKWWQTQEEIERDIQHQAEYQEACEWEERREFWRKITYPIRWPIYRLLERMWPRKSCSVLTDDEIPF